MNNDIFEIVRKSVPTNQRMGVLPAVAGDHFMLMENHLFNTAGRLCEAYNGGFWHFYRLSNGGFYAALDYENPMTILVPGNFYKGEMSADAAGIVICLFVFCDMAKLTQDDRFSRLYHCLLAYAKQHDECKEIENAID